MTRRNKCDACRKAKIKCDESLSGCSNCRRLGKTCTRDSQRNFKFVEVSGGVVTAESRSSTPGHVQRQDPDAHETVTGKRKTTVSIAQRRRLAVYSPGSEQASYQLLPHENFEAGISRPLSPSVLLSRWASLMVEYADHLDCYAGWSEFVPHYLEQSEAIDKAAGCFMESIQAAANPTETNIRILRESTGAAVGSIRLALERKGPRPCKGDTLLAIQLLYMVESLLMLSPVGFLFHATGLINLLKEHKQHLIGLDDQEKAVNQVIFQSTLATGWTSALYQGTDHELDSPGWLTAPLLPRTIPGISSSTTERAWMKVASSFLLTPRLARLVRLLSTLEHGDEVEREAIDLAQHLFTTDVLDADFLDEARASGELSLQPTELPELTDMMPMSFRFGSVRLLALLSCYWACRLFILGLVDSLLSAVPSALDVLSVDDVHDEGDRVAYNAMMTVQHILKTAAMAANRAVYRSDEMRLVMLLQAAFGSWYRLEKRLVEAKESGLVHEHKLGQAKRMKQICLDLVNQLLVASGITSMPEIAMESLVNLFSGGPLLLRTIAFGG